MKIVEILSDECRRGDHEKRDGQGKGCRGRGRINDAKTKIGNFAGEQVRTWCPCACHGGTPAPAKPAVYSLPRAVIPPLDFPPGSE